MNLSYLFYGKKFFPKHSHFFFEINFLFNYNFIVSVYLFQLKQEFWLKEMIFFLGDLFLYLDFLSLWVNRDNFHSNFYNYLIYHGRSSQFLVFFKFFKDLGLFRQDFYLNDVKSCLYLFFSFFFFFFIQALEVIYKKILILMISFPLIKYCENVKKRILNIKELSLYILELWCDKLYIFIKVTGYSRFQ